MGSGGAEFNNLLDHSHHAKPFVVVIDTDPCPSTQYGGYWWDVAVPEVSEREEVRAARKAYEAKLKDRNER